MKKQLNGSPFIIWTLQRTGGTNLASRLIEYSGLLELAKSTTQGGKDAHARALLDKIDVQWQLHEPFNVGAEPRSFGQVTQTWLSTLSAKDLEVSMDEICRQRLPIKHCVEMVPWEISAALAKSSTEHGYRHLFLYRKKALDRLLSLHHAEMTGIWGSHFKNKKQVDEEIFSNPLPQQKLLNHEIQCNTLLVQAWDLLESIGGKPIAMAFEEIYNAANFTNAKERLLWIISELGLSQGIVEDRKLVNIITKWGGQGTKESYSRFEGIGQLKQELESVPALSFGTRQYPLDIETLSGGHQDLIYAAIDVAPKAIKSGHYFDIAGVIVLKADVPSGISLNIKKDETVREINWGIQSPVMLKQFPGGANSANARFKVGRISCNKGEKIEVVLIYPGGESVTVFRLKCGEMATPILDSASEN